MDRVMLLDTTNTALVLNKHYSNVPIDPMTRLWQGPNVSMWCNDFVTMTSWWINWALALSKWHQAHALQCHTHMHSTAHFSPRSIHSLLPFTLVAEVLAQWDQRRPPIMGQQKQAADGLWLPDLNKSHVKTWMITMQAMVVMTVKCLSKSQKQQTPFDK